MKVLVTGSSGFIGGHLVDALIASGHEVIGIDKVTARDPEKHLFLACDILDRAALTAALSSSVPDAVIHLAARTDLDESAGLSGYAANVEGVENVVAAIRSTPSVRRAIFTSTQLVCHVDYRPRSDEDYEPTTIYGKSKVEGEKIVRRDDGGGVTWCIVRPTTVWGPRMSGHYQRFFGMIRNRSYFHIGSKPHLRSLGYVGNVVRQYARMLEAPPERIHRRTFYLADYQPVSLREWADKLAAALGARPIRTLPVSVARVAARLGDGINAVGFPQFPFNSFRLKNVLAESTFDLSETRELCGEMPYSLEAAAAITAAWFLAQSEGVSRG